MQQGSTRRLGDRVLRQAREQDLAPVRITPTPPRRPVRRFESPLILMYGFGSLIAVGTTLLWLPPFNATGEFAPFLDALFTATSAATVTGLVTVDTATFWNTKGHAVIAVMMQIGGLGFMSTATFLLIIITQRITLANQLIMGEFLGVGQASGLLRLTIQVVVLTLVIQSVAFLVLLWRFLPLFDPGQAAWQAGFLTISAFNNAGFNILPGSTSLSMFSSELWVLGIVGSLIILGSISYTVLVEMVRHRRFKRFSLDSRLVIVFSLGLWGLGALVMFVSEFNNEATLKGLPLHTQLVDSLFHSVSGRTAGFTTMDFSDTRQHTNVFFTGLMFIGGASGSTAGGIKINTLAVIIVAVLASIRGRTQVEAFGREIPTGQIQRALTVAFLGVVFVFIVAFLLVITEGFPFDRVILETVSAFGTVGLSTGITPDLSPWGKSIIVATMFIGRIGPLTIALALAQGQRRAIYRYSQERVRIG